MAASLNTDGQDVDEMFGGCAVEFKTDCPHVQLYKVAESLSIDILEPCKSCGHVGENWLCLMCSVVYCSRYVNSHMVAHNAEEPGHMIALSYSDLSVWCYECDSYITASCLQPVIVASQLARAGLYQNIPHQSGDSGATEPGSPVLGVVSESMNPSTPSTSSVSERKEVASKTSQEAAGAAYQTMSKDCKAEASASEETRHFHLETSLSKKELLKHIFGVVYGNCIGDAIGLLTEFMTKEKASQIYNKKKFGLVKQSVSELKLQYNMKHDDKHRSRYEVGDWTDDSDQMILILRTLLDNNGKVAPVGFAKWFVEWKKTGFKELGDTRCYGMGRTTRRVLLRPEFSSDPHKAARYVWEESGGYLAPNGAVMRTSILGVQDFSDIPTVLENTKAACHVTHADPRCLASCVAVTIAIALMLQGKHKKRVGSYDVDALGREAFAFACECLDQEEQKRDLESHMFAETLDDLKLSEDGKIGYTFKTLGAGFWALRQNNFRRALTEIVMEAGDADTNGAVAGALLGCKLGMEALPQSWKDGLLHKQWLDDHINRYLKMLGLN